MFTNKRNYTFKKKKPHFTNENYLTYQYNMYTKVLNNY